MRNVYSTYKQDTFNCMRTQIDYDKSIQRQRLTFKMTTELLLTRILDNSLWLVFLISVGFLLSNKNNFDKGLTPIFVAVFLTVWLLIGLYYINKLVLINGSNPIDNRRRILQFLNDKYPNLKLDDSGQKIIRYDLKTGLFTWGRRITLIFQDENIFINITTFGRYDIKSPFHSIINQLTINKIKKQFELEKNNSR